jgi:DNA-binding MarR family transcriptional regulator
MDPIEELEQAKRASTLQLLIRCARLVDEAARARINAQAGRMVARPSTLALLPHIAHEGTRIVELAQKLGITKQAVSKRVAEMMEEDLLEMVPDPEDGRAKLVRFTPPGRAAIHHGLGVLGELEQQLGASLGEDKMLELRRTLLTLSELLDGSVDRSKDGSI